MLYDPFQSIEDRCRKTKDYCDVQELSTPDAKHYYAAYKPAAVVYIRPQGIDRLSFFP